MKKNREGEFIVPLFTKIIYVMLFNYSIILSQYHRKRNYIIMKKTKTIAHSY